MYVFKIFFCIFANFMKLDESFITVVRVSAE